MQSNHSKRDRASWGVFAALWAVLAAAAGGGASAAPVETVLHSFMGGPSDGSFPEAGLIADSSGNLYGTTIAGGKPGYGTVVKLSPGGTETVLHSFTGGTDGAGPLAGLIADSRGNLYGTAEKVVFKLSPSGTETVLYSFTGGSDGNGADAGLIADSSGNLYGTTIAGGKSGYGTVVKLSPGGTETVLYSFCSLPNCTDGSFPIAGLIADSSGNLYGTTVFGGASGDGVVFKLTPGGTETVLYSFTGGSDGANPYAGLFADSSSNLYGTAEYGGARSCLGMNVGCGVVFKLSPSGTETVLYSFTGGSDGGNPTAGLIADSSGNLYGTTSAGASGSGCGGKFDFGCGVVFKLSPNGTYTVLHSFTGGSDGGVPLAGLIADSSGNLYGTTEGGGDLECNTPDVPVLGCGVVFKLTGTGFVTGIPLRELQRQACDRP